MALQQLELQGLCVDVTCLIMGMIDNNVYIVSDGKGTFVVDPTEQPEAILEALGGRTLDAIVLTHNHNDHIGAACALREATGARVIAGELDADGVEHPVKVNVFEAAAACRVDERVNGGDIVTIGDMQWKVIHTPGHTKGGICLFLVPPYGNHSEGLPVLISGDTLFAGTIGRTDFEGGSLDDMRASLKKLAILPDETVVLPGHNGFTTIGAERRRVFAFYGDEEGE